VTKDSVTEHPVKETVSQKSVSEKHIRGWLDLKYDPLTCLKFFRSSVLKLRFLKLMFDRSKNAFTSDPGPRLNLIPGVGLILLKEMWCAHTRGLLSAAGPLAACGWPMGDYNILRGGLLSEKTAVETSINMRPRPYTSY
jgi:hypothetical protein